MASTTTTASRSRYWREKIAAQQDSGLSARQFCMQQGIAEHSFYMWRRRLQQDESVRFALVETDRATSKAAAALSLELELATGERLRIGAGVDVTTLRTVLEALRA